MFFHGMQSAFINIGIGKNAFIHIKDLLPKIDITKQDLIQEDIRNIIKPGDPILVQITRDTNYKKGARVTKNISLTGRFFVFMPKTPFIAVSQKIMNQDKKIELKELVFNSIPKGSGGIIRTSCENANIKDIIKDIQSLVNLWEKIQKIQIENYPIQIYNNGGSLRRHIINQIDKNLDRIIVNNSNLAKEVRVILQTENVDIPIIIDEKYIKNYNFTNQLKLMENRKIWLKCGGFITIDKTEALTAIDVNTGKYIGKDNFEDTIFKVNKEATIEIAKQLRIRNIGGIIIIDYIDMHVEDNKREIIRIMEKEIKKDSSKVQIEGFTKLDLLEMTRK